MSLLWADDFTLYGSGGQAKMLDGLYAELHADFLGNNTPVLTTDPDPLATGSVVLYTYNHNSSSTLYPTRTPSLRKTFPSAKTTVGGAVRLYMPHLPTVSGTSGAMPVIVFADVSNVAQITFAVTTTGNLEVYRGYIAGTLIGTSTNVLTANAWHHIEWKLVAHASSGTIEIRVDGTTVLTVSGVATVATATVSYSQCALGAYCAATDPEGIGYWKDFIIWDTAGSLNNDFFGPVYVKRLTVNSDVSFNWTASTGSTGYTLVDEAGPNDTDYISADVTQTTQSEFGIENLPADVTSVKGFLLISRMKASDGGDCKVQMGVKSAGDQGLGTDRQITTAYTYWFDVIETSPDTGVQFTPTEFNAATFTIDRTT